MKRKTLSLLLVISFLAVLQCHGEASQPPVFEVRLVLDRPSVDSEVILLPVQTRDVGSGKPFVRVEAFHVRKKPVIDPGMVRRAAVRVDPLTGYPQIEVRLTGEGSRRFAEITRQVVGKRLAISIAGKVQSVPVIRAEIKQGLVLVARQPPFTPDEAGKLAAIINASFAKLRGETRGER